MSDKPTIEVEGRENGRPLPMRLPEMARRPVGVFDSGVGGLTVVRALVDRLPDESILYFGDTARVPYGTKSPETIRHFSRQAMKFLLTREVKIVVVACNTATSHALGDLRSESPVPVLGVVEAGARAAVEATRNGRVGVIGTPGTIGSGAYDRALRSAIPDVQVFAQPCPLLVPLVEEGWADHEATRLVAREYLEPLLEMEIDTLILGCTHYPLLRETLVELAGPGITLVDSAGETARQAEQVLLEQRLRSPGVDEPVRHFTVSDLPLRFREVGRRFLGELMGTVERVDVERLPG